MTIFCLKNKRRVGSGLVFFIRMRIQQNNLDPDPQLCFFCVSKKHLFFVVEMNSLFVKSIDCCVQLWRRTLRKRGPRWWRTLSRWDTRDFVFFIFLIHLDKICCLYFSPSSRGILWRRVSVALATYQISLIKLFYAYFFTICGP